MHINKSNYYSEVNRVGITNLTPTLAHGHKILDNVTKGGTSWDIESPTLSTVIENHLKLFNAFTDNQSKDFVKSHVIIAKPEPLKKETNEVSKGDTVWDSKKQEAAKVIKIAKPSKKSALKDEPLVMDLEYKDGKKSINMPMGERFSSNIPSAPEPLPVIKEHKTKKPKVVKSRIQKAIKAKERVTISPKKALRKQKSVKEIKPPVTTKKYSLELQHIKRYVGMEGKNVKTGSLLRLSKAISKAFNEGSYLDHRELLNSINNTLAIGCKDLERTGQETVDVKLTPEFKTKCKDIISNAKVRFRAEYLAGTDENCDCEKKK